MQLSNCDVTKKGNPPQYKILWFDVHMVKIVIESNTD